MHSDGSLKSLAPAGISPAGATVFSLSQDSPAYDPTSPLAYQTYPNLHTIALECLYDHSDDGRQVYQELLYPQLLLRQKKLKYIVRTIV